MDSSETESPQTTLQIANDANPLIPQQGIATSEKGESAGSAVLSQVGVLFLQYAEPFAESLIEAANANQQRGRKYDRIYRYIDSHEIVKYFLSELCMAAFLDPDNGEVAKAAHFRMARQLQSWLRFSINPSPLLKYKRLANFRYCIFLSKIIVSKIFFV